MSQVEKTNEARQKELQIKELETAVKKKRTTIKRLRTRLENLKKDIRAMQQKMGSAAMDAIEKTVKLQQEMTEVMEKLLKHKKIKLTPEQRAIAEDMLEQFRGADDPEEQATLEDAWEQMNSGPEGFDYEEDARSADAFAEFRPEPSAEEKRDIRKVYLKLSQAFHPDMARNNADRELYHRRMQQISAAYQQHDIEALLRLEQQFLGDEFEDSEEASGPNLLDDKIARLERELSFLESQADRLSVEIKDIRQSDSGQTLTDYDRSERGGYGLNQQMVMMDEAFEGLERSRQVFEDALKKGKVTPELARELEPEVTLEDMLMDMMGSMFDDDGDGDGDDIPFAYGDWVMYQPRKGNESIQISSKTKGFVIETYQLDDFSWVCDVLVEAQAYRAMSDEGWEDMVVDRPYYPLITIPAEDLKPSQKRFDAEESMAVARKSLLDYLLKTRPFSDDARRLLPKVLSMSPSDSDATNWKLYFRHHPLPKGIQVTVGPNPWPHMPEGTEAKLVDALSFEELEGLIVGVKVGRKRPVPFAVRFLNLVEGPPEGVRILSVYQEWAEYRLPEDVESSEYWGLR